LSVRDPFEVAIVGAGPAGAACAIALRRAGIDRVCLLDATRARSAVAIGESIPPDTRTLLDQLGLWPAFLAEDHAPCLGSSSSWGSDVAGFNDFIFNPQGNGWHLDRARFDAFLRRHAVGAGATLIDANAQDVDARFFVDATGSASAIARRAGARQIPLDRMTFIYGFFDATHAQSQSRLTLLEATEDGWWYAASLPGERLAVAFATDPECVRDRELSRDARWLGAALSTRHVAPRVDGCRFIGGSLVTRTVSTFILDRVCGDDWIAVGDAAACYDPLVAQGIYKAMSDGIDAARCITGDATTADYASAARERFEDYVRIRNYFYEQERRWPESRFWQRRQSRTALTAVA
jgi:flavin-dependent dehydrogenase